VVSFLSGPPALWALKGLWKLELATALGGSLDCSRRCELGDEAVVAEAAARREDEDVEVGRECRVQLRRAEPAEVETGRIVRSGEQRGFLFEEVEAWN
jgi:hypothetical protein